MALRYRLKTTPNLGRHLQMLEVGYPETRHAVLLALLEVAPDLALPKLVSDALEPGRKFDHREALMNLQGPCTPAKEEYLKAIVRSEEWINTSAHWMLAWLEVGCRPDGSALLQAASEFPYRETELLGFWAKELGFDRPEDILSNDSLSLERRASFALGFEGLACQSQLLKALPGAEPLAQVQIWRHALRSCPAASVEILAKDSQSVLQLAVAEPREELYQLELSPNEDATVVEAKVELLKELRDPEAAKILYLLASKSRDPILQRAALEALRYLGLPFQLGQGFLPDANDRDLALNYYLWWRQSDAKEPDRISALRLGDDRFPYAIDYFANVGIPPEPIKDLMEKLRWSGTQTSLSSARMIAMFGGVGDLTELSRHPAPAIRNTIFDYAPFNPVAGPWLRGEPDPAIGSELFCHWPAIRLAVGAAEEIRQEAASHPSRACLVARLMQMRGDLAGVLGYSAPQPEGLRLFLNQLVEACTIEATAAFAGNSSKNAGNNAVPAQTGERRSGLAF